MPHVVVEITHIPKPMKGIPYLDNNQERKLAQRGDRFELRLGSAHALAEKGIAKIVGIGKSQAKAIKARKQAELSKARDEVERLEAELATAKKARKAAKGGGDSGKGDKPSK